MANFIERGGHEHVTTHRLFFQRIGDTPGTGFSFPCDPEGIVDRAALYPEGRANLDALLDGELTHLHEDAVVETHTDTVYHYPVIACDDCGEHLMLTNGWLNTCECGADYNGGGQRLAPRSQWGEETGEHWSDTVRIDPEALS